MQQAPDSGFAAGLYYRFDEFDMVAAEIAFTLFMQDADQVDSGILALAQRPEVVRVDDVGFQQANIGVHQQGAVTVWTPARYGNAPAPVGEGEG